MNRIKEFIIRKTAIHELKKVNLKLGTMKATTFGTLSWKDSLKGLIVAIGTALITGLMQSLQSGQLPVTGAQLMPIALAAGSAGLAYIGKNFLTNSEDQFGKKEPVKAEEAKTN